MELVTYISYSFLNDIVFNIWAFVIVGIVIKLLLFNKVNNSEVLKHESDHIKPPWSDIQIWNHF